MTHGPLVDPARLDALLGSPELRVVDCRFELARPGVGERLWLEEHIPGASFLDLDRDLSGEPGASGRHPLPEAGHFESAARRAGIGPDDFVVAYDEAAGGGAARLWWLLRHFGHEAVAVLDGGLSAWREAGLPLAHGPERRAPGRFVARERRGDRVAAGELLDWQRRLFDARAAERFRGEVEPVDALAGHIPGAASLPSAEVTPDGRFLSPAELRERLGGEPFVAYCGSGVTACTLVLAAEVAGVEARLYPGSWSEWSRRGLPVETGP